MAISTNLLVIFTKLQQSASPHFALFRCALKCERTSMHQTLFLLRVGVFFSFESPSSAPENRVLLSHRFLSRDDQAEVRRI